MFNSKGKLVLDENGDIVAEKIIPNEEDTELKFFDKVKIKIEKALAKIYKLRCICCFTSLLAILGVLFLFAEDINLPMFLQVLIFALWLIGVLSAFIACPLKMIGNVIALVTGGVVIGLPFLVVGAVVGLVIALVICFGMVFFFPAVVTIPYYINELNLTDKQMD